MGARYANLNISDEVHRKAVRAKGGPGGFHRPLLPSAHARYYPPKPLNLTDEQRSSRHKVVTGNLAMMKQILGAPK